ncbi:DUF821 domain-containing protein [Dendryphion nanum]|uniref:DUF821 domain-containing protein n=1 Tax=Dendryphion nanum TaxID=256645 RepID=A0A9P9D8E7_9PLEO|nr:DUF821 domain-containing protein [Dendryphion nanum]
MVGRRSSCRILTSLGLSVFLLMVIIGVALYIPAGFGFHSVTLPIPHPNKDPPKFHQPPSHQQNQDDQGQTKQNHHPKVPHERPSEDVGTWKYDPKRDGRRNGLSYAQCNSAFSGMYKDLESSVSHRRSIGDVTEEDVDLEWKKTGAVRAMIYDQKLHILETKFSSSGYDQERALAVLHSLDRAVTSSPEPIPNVEFGFSVSDIADKSHSHHTIWALSRLVKDEKTWLMPDFGYWSWPLELVGGYEEIRAEISENEPPWGNKVAKLLWRGSAKTNSVRADLLRVSKGKIWADVHDVQWKNRTDVGEEESPVAIPEHCDYQFLIQTEGRSYSGRGKYLLNCRSVVFIHKQEWIEPHHALLVSFGPDQNFVEVERNFSDLEVKVEELLKDPDRASKIAENSVATFRDRYLTPAAQACYWRQLLRSWADVSFDPQGWEILNGRKKVRGVPFETFAIQTVMPTKNDCPFWKKLFNKC